MATLAHHRRGFAAFAIVLCFLSCPAIFSLICCDEVNGGQPVGIEWDGSWPAPKIYKISLNSDDGTESGGTWYANGMIFGLDRIGKDGTDDFIAAFRFSVPDLEQGEEVKYARVLLSAQGGSVTSQVSLTIRGIDEDSPETFSDSRRPSQLPKTDDSVAWCLTKAWATTGTERALYRSTPNIARILNEILSKPGWGQGAEGRQIALTIEENDCNPGEANYLHFEDFSTEWETRDQAILEVYPSLADAFVAKPMLGRVGDSSIVINVMNLLEIDVYAEYGTESGVYGFSTGPLLNEPPQRPVEIIIGGLVPDTTYYYRIRYREAGSGTFLEGMEGSFHTQRPPGSQFVFAVQSDAHPHLSSGIGECQPVDPAKDWNLYDQTLANIASDLPDFLIDLGDFVDIECEGYSRNVLCLEEAIGRYLEQREHLDKITHSIPFYLVLGNHEGEQGWRVLNEGDSVEVWGTLARKQLIPNPGPDDFYAGSQESTSCCGLRENYYAWEWGDALFVVIDPFWHTTKVPHWYTEYPRQGDGWEWTLGDEQYIWFYETLQNSGATWKFVFAHHEAGGVLTGNSYYGRGGIEAAKYEVDGRPSFEWGGQDADGNSVFDTKRPGWDHGPIHDIMASEGVTIFFHGHDHVYVYQMLEGVVYQACPRPKDSCYSDGFYDDGHYSLGTKHKNSGHLRITVSPDAVQVDYVRSVLAEDEPLLEDTTAVYNRDVSHSYTTTLSRIGAAQPISHSPHLFPNQPNPFRTFTTFDFFVPKAATARIAIYDVRGQLLRVLLDGSVSAGTHHISWDGVGGLGRVPAGVYFCRLEAIGYRQARKLVVVR